jgi:hypothetical protein
VVYMQVVEQTQSRLVTQARPDKRWLLFAGGAFIMAGGILIALMTDSVVTLTCRRNAPMEGKIELASSRLLTSTTRDIPLTAVTGVVIKAGISRGGGGVFLRTSDGEFSLASLSSGRADQLAAELTGFLSNPRDLSLTIRQDDRLITYSIALGMIAVGVLILALGFETVTCDFDKAGSTVTLARKGVLGTRKAEYEIRDISDVRAEWVSRRKKGKAVYLILKSGARVHAGWPDRSDTLGVIPRFLGISGGSLDDE